MKSAHEDASKAKANAAVTAKAKADEPVQLDLHLLKAANGITKEATECIDITPDATSPREVKKRGRKEKNLYMPVTNKKIRLYLMMDEG